MNIKEMVEKYLAYWNQADIAGLMSMYDTGMLYHDLPSGDVIEYKNLKSHITNTFAFGTLNLKDAVYLDDASAFIYWTQNFEAENQGKTLHTNGVELITFRSDKIISIHEFYDYQGVALEAVVPTEKTGHADQMTKLGLTDSLMKDIGDNVTIYFHEQKPYLDPEINLTKVSDRLGYTRNQVSYVINHVLGKTFYDLVSEQRIDHVVKQMSIPGSHTSILELAISAGFNSMSGFYNVFKKQTGMSPVQYQKANFANIPPQGP